MKLPEFPDLSVFEEIRKSKPIRLEPGERFIAQVDSIVMPTHIQQAIGKMAIALIEYLPCLFEATELGLELALSPMTPEIKADIQEAIGMYKNARELFTKKTGDPIDTL